LNIDVHVLFQGVIGCWVLVAHSVFLIFYHAFKIQSEMTKRCKEAECWTFSGKSTHSSWKIRLLLIIFGTYIQLNLFTCALLSNFLNIFEPRTLRTIDPSDYRPFGPMTLRTNEPSDQCPGTQIFTSVYCEVFERMYIYVFTNIL